MDYTPVYTTITDVIILSDTITTDNYDSDFLVKTTIPTGFQYRITGDFFLVNSPSLFIEIDNKQQRYPLNPANITDFTFDSARDIAESSKIVLPATQLSKDRFLLFISQAENYIAHKLLDLDSSKSTELTRIATWLAYGYLVASKENFDAPTVEDSGAAIVRKAEAWLEAEMVRQINSSSASTSV